MCASLTDGRVLDALHMSGGAADRGRRPVQFAACWHDPNRQYNEVLWRGRWCRKELGHAILHEEFDSRPLAELEAESVAFIVCSEVGIESDDYSFGYVATWAGGSDEAQKAIKASGSRIQKAADQILSAIVAGNGPLN